MLRVHVDRSACRGAGVCVRRAPGTFSLDREGRSRAASPPRNHETTIRAAAGACPFFAIAVEDEDEDAGRA